MYSKANAKAKHFDSLNATEYTTPTYAFNFTHQNLNFSQQNERRVLLTYQFTCVHYVLQTSSRITRDTIRKSKFIIFVIFSQEQKHILHFL